MTENFTLRRTATVDNIDDLLPLLDYAFTTSPPFDIPEGDERAKLERLAAGTEAFVLYDGATPIASSASVPLTMNLRGQIVPVWGVWGVTCEPQYRRKGLARKAMLALLEAARDAAIPYSTLYPFRESFYERLGYVMYPHPRHLMFKPATMGSLLNLHLPGTIERVLIQDGWDTYRDYLYAMQQYTHGMAVADGSWPAGWRRENNDHWLALARIEGEVRGLMMYKIEGKDYKFNLNSSVFYAQDITARMLLLNWIARHVDQISEVTLTVLPTDYPETWWPDLKPDYKQAFGPLGRVVDVTRIGGLPTGPGSVTARISDSLCAWNDGVYRFETVDGALTVERITGSQAARPDCDMSIQGLSALVYGIHTPEMFAFRGWGDPAPAVQATLRQMFPPQIPYLHERF